MQKLVSNGKSCKYTRTLSFLLHKMSRYIMYTVQSDYILRNKKEVNIVIAQAVHHESHQGSLTERLCLGPLSDLERLRSKGG